MDDLASFASSARFERATPAFGRRCSHPLSYDELRVDGRSRTCTLRIRSPVPCPFGHVDKVRALGLEPSLFRGKGPVPYQSGVTRAATGAATSRAYVEPVG